MAEPEIEEFRIELRVEATVTVNQETWIKPGAASSIRWNGVPDERAISAATGFIMKEVLEPTLNDVIQLSRQRVIKAHGVKP